MKKNNLFDKNLNINPLLFEEVISFSRKELLNYSNFTDKKNIERGLLIAKAIKTRTKHVKDRFFWPNAMFAIALEYSHKTFFDKNDMRTLINYYENWIKQGVEINNLDYTMNGYSLIYVYEQTQDDNYLMYIDKLADFLIKDYPKDINESIPYRDNMTNNIYIDSLGMICPFLCRYGKLTNRIEATELAIKQLLNFMNLGIDEKTKLPYHAFNAKEQSKLGIIGWGRSVGWLMWGLVDSLEYIERTNIYYDVLVQYFNELAINVISYQHELGHFSWQLETLEGPKDTSSTSMIVYSLLKGVKLGILDKSFNIVIEKGVTSLNSSIDNGRVLNSSAECRGLGMYPQIYGCYPWSQGPTTAIYALLMEKT